MVPNGLRVREQGQGSESMIRIKDFKGTAMEWVQPKFSRRSHELRAGDDAYASLAWQKIIGSLAVVESSDDRFTLKRGGFLHPHVTIREEGSMDDLAVFHIGLLGNGLLEFRDGRRYVVHKLSFWGYSWGFYDEYERLLCTIKKRSTTLKHRGDVRIERDTRRDRYLLVLLVAGWYAMVMASEEAASVAAASASS